MSRRMEIVQPDGWAKPRGYSNGILVEGGRTLYISGQVAFDAKCKMVGVGCLVTQFEQTLRNIASVVATAGGSLKDVVKMSLFVTDKVAYKAAGKEIGAIYRAAFGDHYPVMSLFEIADFYDEDVLIEIESIAVLP